MHPLSKHTSSCLRLGRLAVAVTCLLPAAAEARPRDGRVVVRPNRIVIVPPRHAVFATPPGVIPPVAVAAPVLAAPVAAVVPAPRLLAPRRVALVPVAPLVAAPAVAPVVTQVVRETVVVPAPAPQAVAPAPEPSTSPTVIVQPPVEFLPSP